MTTGPIELVLGPEPEPPSFSRLEEWCSPARLQGLDEGLDALFEKYRAALRAAIMERLRELARTEQVELQRRVCGEVVERSPSHSARVRAGRAPRPVCESCRWPERAALQDAEAARFVEALADQVDEFSGVLASLR
jgi:hypothetical protein